MVSLGTLSCTSDLVTNHGGLEGEYRKGEEVSPGVFARLRGISLLGDILLRQCYQFLSRFVYQASQISHGM